VVDLTVFPIRCGDASASKTQNSNQLKRAQPSSEAKNSSASETFTVTKGNK
jgi:hypothetical protein